jgi:hypothetical protein
MKHGFIALAAPTAMVWELGVLMFIVALATMREQRRTV